MSAVTGAALEALTSRTQRRDAGLVKSVLTMSGDTVRGQAHRIEQPHVVFGGLLL